RGRQRHHPRQRPGGRARRAGRRRRHPGRAPPLLELSGMDFTTFSPAVVLVTVVFIALAPFVAVMVTSFTKIVVVLSLLRNALGLQQVPPNVVINGLAIVLSAYVMSPVIMDTHPAVSAHLAGEPPPARIQARIDERAAARAERLAARRAQGAAPVPGPAATPPPTPPARPGAPMDAARMLGVFEAGKEPLRGFLIHHSNDAERAFFLRSAQRLLPADRRDDLDVDDFIVVIPAFTVSELTTAFQIGFLIFLPFLIIDLVV